MKHRSLITFLVLAMLIAALSLVAGCSSAADDPELQTEFLAMLEETPTPDAIAAAYDQLAKILPKLEPENKDPMILAYEHYLLKYVNDNVDFTVIDQMAPYFDFSTKSIDPAKIPDEKLAATLTKLMDAGLKLTTSEGMVYPIIDYGSLIDKLQKQMSEALFGLYQLKAVESQQSMSEDNGLVITWGGLALRAAAVEAYIREYKDVELIREEAVWIYRNYINTMLMGMNNTPAFDYETGAYNQEALDAFAAFLQQNQNTTTGWVLEEFFAYLDSIQYKMDYNDSTETKSFYDTCSWLVSEAGKRVFQ